MDIRRLSPDFAVAPQILPTDLATIAGDGFRTVINNRPDGEAPDQPGSAELRAAAEQHGLDYRPLPVISGQVGDDDADAFAELLEATQGPVLAFCRTGTRSVMLWALAEARRQPVARIVDAAARAGYDLQGLRPRLESRRAAGC